MAKKTTNVEKIKGCKILKTNVVMIYFKNILSFLLKMFAELKSSITFVSLQRSSNKNKKQKHGTKNNLR